MQLPMLLGMVKDDVARALPATTSRSMGWTVEAAL